jgi:oxygen-independent coproporphyrinogen-3 oxidase
MCYLRVDLEDVAARHGTDAAVFNADMEALQALEQDGLVQVEGYKITVPEASRPLVRSVAAAFDAYLHPEADRHARAI